MRKLLLWGAGLLLSIPAMAMTEGGQQQMGIVTEGNFVVGAGFGGFTHTLGDETAVGPSWEGRGGLVLGNFFGIEANYQGLSSSVDAAPASLIVPSGTNYMAHQITADFVPGIPLLVGNRILRPYGLVGIGYARLGANNTTLGLIDSQGVDAVAVPLGAGISYNITHGFVVDARYTYNFLNTSGGNTWNLGFNLGASFGGI